MRVISGVKKGFKLAAGNTGKIRPTTDRTRKVIFDVIGERIHKSIVLDVFAGSGSLGIEALSRGAAKVTFIEKSRYAISVLQRNLQKTGFQSEAVIFSSPADQALKTLARSTFKFDLIFADPPYHQSLAQSTISAVEEYDLLVNQGWLVLEHSKRNESELSAARMNLAKRTKQGETMVSFYRNV